MNWKPSYALLILTSTIVTWVCSLYIESALTNDRKKLFLVFSLVINIGILVLFKYFNFFNTTTFQFLEIVNLRWKVPNLEFLLPVGISFYTFQAVGYTIDVYRGNVKAERHFGIYALFVSFFPQLVAGPIERANNLLPQFKEVKVFSYSNFSAGFKMMIWGYFLKLVLADRLAFYVDAVYNNIEQHTGSTLALASFLFSFQIYGDFAGYSLIAIGAAKVMGFDLMTNFNRPYFATSIGDFWSRWHISLSTWFKDYLYIPLGGNRVSTPRHYFNLLITFIVSGIWHGANFTFLFWGSLHGIYLILEKRFGTKLQSRKRFSWEKIIRILFTFLLVNLAWIFFRANSIGEIGLIFHKIFTGIGDQLFFNWEVFFAAGIALSILIVKETTEEFLPHRYSLLRNQYSTVRIISYAALTSIIVLLGVFVEGQFIYFQF